MANNRLWVFCDGCGKGTLLLKSLGGWFEPSYLNTSLVQFMEQHATCAEWGDCTEPIAFSFKFECHPDPGRRIDRNTL